jgi:hypothetical protein
MSETQEAAASSSASPTSAASSWKLPDGIENHIESGNENATRTLKLPMQL